MSSIAGFFQPNTVYSKENEFCIKTIHAMSQALIHRGPDEQSYYYFPQGAFSQNYLLAGYIPGIFPHRMQPLTMDWQGNTYTLLFDGFVTNPEQIAMGLETQGISTREMSLEELLMVSFLVQGADFIREIQGGFALAVYDEGARRLLLFRDPLGLRPLFFTAKANALVFASEIKGLFPYPGIAPVLDRDGLAELLSLGPARRPGSGVFQDIYEVKPGHYITYSRDGLRDTTYHHFEIREHTDSYEDTLGHITYLLNQSMEALSGAVMPAACLLSGGLDSSVVTASLASKSRSTPATYSLEFDNSQQHFKSNAFQPSLDAPYAKEMSSHLGTKHTVYTCNSKLQLDYLRKSVLAHDLPAMADVDSSYLFFCEKISKQHKIIFTGECADEIFCGYPWYYASTNSTSAFPWSHDLSQRQLLLNDNLTNTLPLKECVAHAYQETCQEMNLPDGLSPAASAHHRTFYLTIRYFMQTLVNRGDRAAASYSMDARMPFASLALTEYLYNVPLELQGNNDTRKHLLREYASGLLPEEIRSRRKSPYPKTYDPGYELLVNRELLQALSKPDCPLHIILDKNKVDTFCRQSKDLGKPWYGQLMAGPQLAAYYLQVLYWLEQYSIEIKL